MKSRSSDRDAIHETENSAVTDAPVTDFISVRRRRLTRESYQKKQRTDSIKRFILSVLPFILFITGLALLSVGLFRYVEHESALTLLLSKPAAGAPVLGGAGWNRLPTIAPTPTQPQAVSGPDATEAGQTPDPTSNGKTAILKNGRLIAPFYYIGEQFGTIRIPTVKIEVGVFQGDSEQELRQGAGHYTFSMMPGQDGNILIAGHRTSYFRKFEYLKIGDLVQFETTYGDFTYRVREFRIINGSDASVARPTEKEQLTMYTCYPFTYVGNAPKRYVVMCDLVEKAVRT